MSDEVNHPDHYNTHESGIECIEVVRHMNFNLGNVIKYVWRAPYKGVNLKECIQDYKKAAWYLKDEIERLEMLLSDDQSEEQQMMKVGKELFERIQYLHNKQCSIAEAIEYSELIHLLFHTHNKEE